MAVVDITYGDLTPEALEEVVKDPSVVRSFDLSGNNISPVQCEEIVKKYVANMSNLEELDWKDNRIGPNGCEILFNALIAHCPKISYVDINENAVLDESMYPVALLLSTNRLRSLFLVTNHITPRGIPTLCDGLRRTNNLKELSLDFNVLGDKGATMLVRAIRAHPSLEVLGLSDNSIGDAGAVEIAANIIMSATSRVRSMNLSVNRIGSLGFTAISDALAQTRNPSLHHLDLGCNPVEEEGRRAFFSRSAQFTYLESLDLSSCNLDSEDAIAFTKVLSDPKTCCAVTRFDWYNNPAMNAKSEQALMQAVDEAAERSRNAYERKQVAKSFAGGILVAAAFGGIAAIVIARLRMRQ